MKLYLDTNIFIYLENGTLSLKDLEDLVECKIDKIIYSPSHIQETLEIKGVTKEERQLRINHRLKTIGDYTQNNYINEDLNNTVTETVESPFDVFETITQVPFGQNAMKGLMNFISEKQKNEIRCSLGIEPERINNYSPIEVVDHLSQKLSTHGKDYTFLGMIEIGISYHPDGKKFGRSNRISAIFELLDLLGYWKDKPTEKSNYARLWDSSHCFYASFCDCFVSNDKRTINKTNVVYEIFNIGTKIIMPFENIG